MSRPPSRSLAAAGASSVASSSTHMDTLNKQIVELLDKQRKASDELKELLVSEKVRWRP